MSARKIVAANDLAEVSLTTGDGQPIQELYRAKVAHDQRYATAAALLTNWAYCGMVNPGSIPATAAKDACNLAEAFHAECEKRGWILKLPDIEAMQKLQDELEGNRQSFGIGRGPE